MRSCACAHACTHVSLVRVNISYKVCVSSISTSPSHRSRRMENKSSHSEMTQVRCAHNTSDRHLHAPCLATDAPLVTLVCGVCHVCHVCHVSCVSCVMCHVSCFVSYVVAATFSFSIAELRAWQSSFVAYASSHVYETKQDEGKQLIRKTLEGHSEAGHEAWCK